MHRDLERISGELTEAQARMHRLAESVDDVTWTTRPPHAGWSIDECVSHLTLTNQRYLPILEAAADQAPAWFDGRDGQPDVPDRLRRDLAGWFLTRMMEPPVRFRLPTAAPFEPPGPASRSATVAAFDATQAALLNQIRDMDGLNITTIRIRSPFNQALRYSAWSALCILAAHERRHIWQAERVRDALARRPPA